MNDYKFFSKDPGQGREAFQSLWGHLDICPLLNQFHFVSITHSELSSLTSLKAWEDAEKFCSDVAFLLVLTEKGAARDRIYGLSMIWVNSYQTRVPTIEEVVKQLTTLVSTRLDWPYALVWLNGDAHHMPLPREGHLSALVEGGTSSDTCRRVSQLLVLTEEGAARDRIYGLSMIWVNPYQTRVPTMEEVVKQLTTLVSTRPDWPYALVWLNGDAHHMPLPR